MNFQKKLLFGRIIEEGIALGPGEGSKLRDGGLGIGFGVRYLKAGLSQQTRGIVKSKEQRAKSDSICFFNRLAKLQDERFENCKSRSTS